MSFDTFFHLNHPHVQPMPQKRKTHNQKNTSSHKCRNNEAKTLEKKEDANKQLQAGDQIGIDRLSDLPEPIIHDILLSLPLSDAISTKSLSRRWRHSIWPSCPALYFDEYSCPVLYFDEYSFGANYFQYCTGDDENRRRFTEFLLEYLQKQKEGRSTNHRGIDKFGIRMALLGAKSDPVVDGWLNFAIENNVKELDLRIKRVLCQCFNRYWLGDSVFACHSLTALRIDYCAVPLDCLFDLPSLKKLTLSDVKITEDEFGCLIGGCPLVEDLCVQFCKGLYTMEVTAPNLKSLKLNITDVNRLSIRSTSLESVEISGDLKLSLKLDFAAIGRTLREVKLKNLFITDNLLINLIDGSPMLESLAIEGCRGLYSVRVSQNIKRFCMFRCRGIVEAKVFSSNLKSMEYSGDVKISFCCWDNLRLAEVKISLDPPIELSSEWFFRLKKLLKGFVKSKVLTLVCPSDQVIIFPGALWQNLLPPLHDLKHLRLEISTLSTTCSAIVDGLIWLFPGLETLTIKSGSINKLIKL
ncbi:hypothetical protein RHSIM_Rhsim07G0244500 [Rhododendron simsii]|uniref:F-box domain-containing protein n=1 Tax=Rhododendron simsii TaxID=118357 RepID=A0A834LJC9_RHOSS|nr:hypothetical protein RHSIM_Rhsim07G0244500 [Rhododendron simsii]